MVLKQGRIKNIIGSFVVVCLAFTQNIVYGQQEQTGRDSAEKNNRNIFQFMIGAIKRDPKDSAREATILNTGREIPFLQYQGKIIRKIVIREYGFERTFADTSKQIQYFGTKILNALHRNTREWVIRSNLFINESTPLNLYVVADNERYLRSLNYIEDARILINAVSNTSDSVDVIVITKDLFSLTGELNDISPQLFKAKVGDVNVAGMGQSLFFTGMIEKDRSPGFGYEIAYAKNNIANTFINAAASYSTIRQDLSYGFHDETAWQFGFERPLFSQYSHLAGGLLLGRNTSHNNYKLPDSLFYDYDYKSFDAWIGYNLGVEKLLHRETETNKKFISFRYFRNRFLQTPYQVQNNYNFRYDNKEALLAGITFFKQNFYKTNYIYGFGTTEDMPYGYNIAITGGWYKQAGLSRPYAGIEANKYVYTNSAYFIQYYLRTGGFLHDGKIEDANFLIGSGVYSKLFLYRDLKIRQYFNLSFTRQFNRIGVDPLQIDNPFGVRYFHTDSVLGNQRISLYSETFIFLNGKIFGFRFSPFFFGNISLLKPQHQPITKSNAYYGLGGGVRTRNENLVFGTIELRFAYFPRKIDQQSFKVTLSTNLRFKYNTGYVHAPDIVQVNNDIRHDIY